MRDMANPYDVQFGGDVVTVFTWRWNRTYACWTPRYFGSSYDTEQLLHEYQLDRNAWKTDRAIFFNAMRYYADGVTQ